MKIRKKILSFIVIIPQNHIDKFFYVPKLTALGSLFGSGEYFHVRSKISSLPDSDMIIMTDNIKLHPKTFVKGLALGSFAPDLNIVRPDSIYTLERRRDIQREWRHALSTYTVISNVSQYNTLEFVHNNLNITLPQPVKFDLDMYGDIFNYDNMVGFNVLTRETESFFNIIKRMGLTEARQYFDKYFVVMPEDSSEADPDERRQKYETLMGALGMPNEEFQRWEEWLGYNNITSDEARNFSGREDSGPYRAFLKRTLNTTPNKVPNARVLATVLEYIEVKNEANRRMGKTQVPITIIDNDSTNTIIIDETTDMVQLRYIVAASLGINPNEIALDYEGERVTKGGLKDIRFIPGNPFTIIRLGPGKGAKGAKGASPAGRGASPAGRGFWA